MPIPGNGTTSPLIAEPGMSSSTVFNTEYDLFDSDDGLGGSPLPFIDFINTDSDALQSFEASRTGDPKALLAPNPHSSAQPAGATPESLNASFQDSASDSSSSKRTGSSSSTKTGITSGDVMMTDGLDLKAEADWNPENFVNGNENDFLAFDGTIDPSSIDGTFNFSDRGMENAFDFGSPSNSPSPFATGTIDGASPQTQATFTNSSIKGSPAAAKSPARGHNKAFSQYSLTQSMNGLRTNGSREVSPTSHMVFSQDSSPSAMFNNSPSPSQTADFANGLALGVPHGNAMWAQGMKMPTSPLQHGGSIQGALNVAAPAAIPAAMPYPLFQQPSYPSNPQLIISPIPPKSRVETQIPIRMSLFPLPPGIKRLHLPTHTISKPKLLAKPRPDPSADLLELHTTLVCTSAMQNPEMKKKALARAAANAPPFAADSRSNEGASDDDEKPQSGGEVGICDGCMMRERKRAARKKAKKPEEEESWLKDERKRVIVFNTQEIKEWQAPTAIVPNTNPPEQFITNGAMQIDAPMRIACYCRHHGEKSGFQVIFTIKDWRGQLIAQALSPSIMITDDHKTHTVTNQSSANTSETSLMPPTAATAAETNGLSTPGQPFRLSHSVSDLQSMKRNASATFPQTVSGNPSQATSAVPTPRNLSRPASPSGNGPSSKKRKSSGSAKVPSGLAMTRLETANLSNPQANQAQLGLSAATSPFSPSMTSFPSGTADGVFVQPNLPQPFPTGPPTPNDHDQVLFNPNNDRATSMNDITMAQLYSAPASAHPSRAPSPNGLRNSAMPQQQQTQFNHALTSGLFASAGATATRVPPSVIHKVIPNEGPISGGVEVTILGEGFYQGLEVMFGDRRATTTTFWGETSLVCLLPPASIAGPVLVSLKSQNARPSNPFTSSKQHPIFNYTDDYENQLIRTALTVMSAKMTGKIEDAREIARRLQMPGGGSSGGNDYNGNGGSSGNTYNVNFETQLLKVLEFLDLDDSTNKARLNLRRKSGHAMLHLACALGLHRFVAGLLARGANPDVKDKGGFTPLHFASLNDQPEIVRRLIYAGADPTLRSINGLTAADVAQSRDVIRAIRRVERHVRSRSGGSLHSRASSATSLRSLWEPPSAPVASVEFSTEESESAGESPEYTSGDFNSEEDDLAADGSAWLELRRSSTRGSVHSPIAQDGGRTPLHVTNADVPGGLASPTAAMTAFRDQVAAQIHQFQQSMALQLQNLPHFPYFSQMPNMPPMPDYQAYLNSAPPVLQRMTSFLPNMGGSRPGSAGEQPQSKEMEGRWWGVSSLMPTSSAPPPSYDEIFPQQDLDKKQSSAAQAAAEAEADSKCATLYDQPSTSSAPVQQLPKLLQIGRKNAITKEQQDNLRRAHAENLKRLSRDRNLFFIWIPLLVMIMCSMLYSRFPGAFSAVFSFLPSFTSNTQALQTIPERVVEIA